MNKKIRFFMMVACAFQLTWVSLAYAQDAQSPAAAAPNAKESKKAARRVAAIAEVKQLLSGLTAETNKLSGALNASQEGKEVIKALDVWATYLDGWKKRAKSMEGKKGFKFLKASSPPNELKGDMEAFMTSVQVMSQTLQGKIDLYKDNPKFQKRIEIVIGKLKDM